MDGSWLRSSIWNDPLSGALFLDGPCGRRVQCWIAGLIILSDADRWKPSRCPLYRLLILVCHSSNTWSQWHSNLILSVEQYVWHRYFWLRSLSIVHCCPLLHHCIEKSSGLYGGRQTIDRCLEIHKSLKRLPFVFVLCSCLCFCSCSVTSDTDLKTEAAYRSWSDNRIITPFPISTYMQFFHSTDLNCVVKTKRQ